MKNKTVFEKIVEGNTNVLVFKNKKKAKGPGSKEGVPFYNPSMELNRDLSIVFAQWMVDNSKKKIKILDGLAASGIHGVRIGNEVKGDFEVLVNDWNDDSYNLILENIKENKLKNVEASHCNLNAMLSEQGFDYIDVDPFGSPADFVDSAIRSIKNNGVISFTATDTATLCGVYPKVCWRRYGAMPFHSVAMKEIAIRILLGFICKTAGIHDKGIKPLLSYSTDHYFRVYVKFFNSVSKANSSMGKLKVVKSGEMIGLDKADKDVGPIWTGDIQDKKTLAELRDILFKKELGRKNEVWKLIDLLEEEADNPTFFYTTESLSSLLKTSSPKQEMLFEGIKKQGYIIKRTHFSPTSFKTDAPLNVIQKVFKQ
jgi:tRNA (guanine26-N2/guanine27-N2)-dimethyltransferase